MNGTPFDKLLPETFFINLKNHSEKKSPKRQHENFI